MENKNQPEWKFVKYVIILTRLKKETEIAADLLLFITSFVNIILQRTNFTFIELEIEFQNTGIQFKFYFW